MSTVRELLTASLSEIGVLAEGETMSAGQGSHGLLALNRLIDQWKAERFEIFTVTRTTSTLTANQASFTVGTGGNINIVRPVFIEKVNYIDTSLDPDFEYQLPELLSEQAWRRIAQKALTSTYPQRAYYNPTFTSSMGTLHPWPIPTSSTLQWAIYHWAAIAAFVGLTDTVTLPPGYEELIVTWMAVKLAATYGRPVDPDLRQRAQQAKAIVERPNLRMSDLSFNPAALVGGRGHFDIRTGE